MTPQFPYSAAEAKTLGEVFVGLGVPSLSPGMGTVLLQQIRILEDVKKRADITPEMAQVIQEYISKAYDIAQIAGYMQQNVIGQLERAVFAAKCETTGKSQGFHTILDEQNKKL